MCDIDRFGICGVLFGGGYGVDSSDWRAFGTGVDAIGWDGSVDCASKRIDGDVRPVVLLINS